MDTYDAIGWAEDEEESQELSSRAKPQSLML